MHKILKIFLKNLNDGKIEKKSQNGKIKKSLIMLYNRIIIF